jgi:hypothetical protein
MAKTHMEARINAEARAHIGGDEQIVDSINTRYGALTFKHLLLPVWLLAYRYQDRSYQVLVNAGTGEVNGERPYSVWKIASVAILATIVAMTVWFFTSR